MGGCKPIPVVVLWCLLLTAHIQCAQSTSEGEHLPAEQNGVASVSDQPVFDILIFTQSWSFTKCYAWRERDNHNKCLLPTKADDGWTIHGIWPTKLHTIGPAFCNKTAVFDVDQLSSVKQQLAQQWTNVEANTPYDSLWEHEWLKHGTCAASVIDRLDTELKYFSRGLYWNKQYVMGSILANADIVPGQHYTLDAIHKALQTHLGKNAGIECYHDSDSGQQLLDEIRICFTKDLALTDCDGIKMESGPRQVPSDDDLLISNCHPHKPIVYTSSTMPPPSVTQN